MSNAIYKHRAIDIGIGAGMTLLCVALLHPAFAAALEQPDPTLCNALIKHTPAPDVAYQPGVDVHGNAVAPADLPGQTQIKLPDRINIPLTLGLAQALHMNTATFPANQLGAGTELPLGTLSIEGDKVFLNDQPLTDAQQDNLAVLCLQPNK